MPACVSNDLCVLLSDIILLGRKFIYSTGIVQYDRVFMG